MCDFINDITRRGYFIKLLSSSDDGDGCRRYLLAKKQVVYDDGMKVLVNSILAQRALDVWNIEMNDMNGSSIILSFNSYSEFLKKTEYFLNIKEGEGGLLSDLVWEKKNEAEE